MGFSRIIRDSVALANRLTADLQVPVEHHAWIGAGDTSEPVYAPPVTRMALVEMRQRFLRLNGEDIILKASISFLEPFEGNGAEGRQEPIDPRDLFVLPNGYSGPIRSIEGLENNILGGTPYTLEVTLG